MPDILLKAARKSLKNQFGEAFGAKATDAFVRKYFLQNQHETAVLREATPSVVQNSIILEFDGSQANEVKREANFESTARDSRIHEVIASIPEPTKHVKAAFNQLLKTSKIKSYKEKSLMNAQSINDIVEKRIGESFIHKAKSISDQPYVTQYCWLNQSLKALTDPISIAEAIQDHKVTSVDIPRKLVKEINKTVPGIFASQFVQKFSKSGKNISIAVIDSEIFVEHPALKNRAFKMENYTIEPWGNPDFHGTAIAGIIGSNDATFVGIAPEAKLYNYKVLGTNVSVNADDFGGSKAIEKALEDGMHIANCSWGIEKVSSVLSREAKACNTAWELGLTIVKSAGNNGAGVSTLTTPAEAEGIIVVGATGKNFVGVENYSSRGPIPSNSLRPHLIAPGGSPTDNIVSCRISSDFGPVGYGTSYAAPHVSGLLALILEENPDLSNDELRDFAIKLCTVLQDFNPEAQGNGIISLRSLVI
ncbi:MAG: S8 family serine peptidase [Ferruginibacter sp.]